MKAMLIKLGAWLLKSLPIERILAAVLNRAIDSVNAKNMESALKTVEHISEICDLVTDILADRTVSEDESSMIVKQLADLRTILLEKWACGDDCKDVQKEIAALSVDNPTYA